MSLKENWNSVAKNHSFFALGAKKIFQVKEQNYKDLDILSSYFRKKITPGKRAKKNTWFCPNSPPID